MCRKGRRSSLTHCRTAVSINYPMKMETATHKYRSRKYFSTQEPSFPDRYWRSVGTGKFTAKQGRKDPNKINKKKHTTENLFKHVWLKRTKMGCLNTWCFSKTGPWALDGMTTTSIGWCSRVLPVHTFTNYLRYQRGAPHRIDMLPR